MSKNTFSITWDAYVKCANCGVIVLACTSKIGFRLTPYTLLRNFHEGHTLEYRDPILCEDTPKLNVALRRYVKRKDDIYLKDRPVANNPFRKIKAIEKQYRKLFPHLKTLNCRFYANTQS